MARDIFIRGIVTDNVPDGFVACCEEYEYDCGADVFVQRWGRSSNQKSTVYLRTNIRLSIIYRYLRSNQKILGVMG